MAVLVAADRNVQATQVVAVSLDQMVDQSHIIVWGTVSSSVATWMPEGPGRIHTVTSVKVSQWLKNAPINANAAQIEFIVPGGEVGRVGQWVAGSPRFAKGDKVVVFLEKQSQTGRLLIVGFSQGLYRVEKSNNRPEQAVSDRRGIRLLIRDQRGALRPAPASTSVVREPLSSLLNRIHERVKKKK